MNPNGGSEYIALLKDLGIDVSQEAWDAVHGKQVELPSPILPCRPHTYDGDMPVFTSSQLEWCEPELYGFFRYEVVEDEAAAHPFALEYNDEIQWKLNHRPVHRYDRQYRIRRTLQHMIGCVGHVPSDVIDALTKNADMSDRISTRGCYEWARAQLKGMRRPDLYKCIPTIINVLGGPRWALTTDQYRHVHDDAMRLHGVFNHFKKLGHLRRQRFPKMQFVVLRLLDRHGVAPPYRVPWARTSIKRRQLRNFISSIEERPLYKVR